MDLLNDASLEVLALLEELGQGIAGIERGEGRAGSVFASAASCCEAHGAPAGSGRGHFVAVAAE